MDLFVKKLFKGDSIVWILLLLLMALSVVECFSALGTLAYKRDNMFMPILRHAGILFAGFVLVVVLHNVPYKWTGFLSYPLMGASVFLLVLALFSENVGVELNEAKRWVEVFGIQFQPSELAKISLVIFIAWTLGTAHKEVDGSGYVKAFWKVIIATGIVVLLIITQNMSTAIMIAVFAYLMLFIGGAPKKHMIWLTVVVGGGALLVYIALTAIPDIPGVDRWASWHNRLVPHSVDVLDPSYTRTDENSQVHYAKIAISQGKFLGALPGNSTQRDFLPQAYSDFIYAIIIEDMGWLGMLLVPALYIILLFRCRKIAKSCTKMTPALLAMGAGLIVALQAFVNMAVAVGFFPVTGQAMPIVSRGGTSSIITCCYFALILSVSRYGASDSEEEVWQSEDQELDRLEAEEEARQAVEQAAQQAPENISAEDYASMAE